MTHVECCLNDALKEQAPNQRSSTIVLLMVDQCSPEGTFVAVKNQRFYNMNQELLIINMGIVKKGSLKCTLLGRSPYPIYGPHKSSSQQPLQGIPSRSLTAKAPC